RAVAAPDDMRTRIVVSPTSRGTRPRATAGTVGAGAAGRGWRRGDDGPAGAGVGPGAGIDGEEQLHATSAAAAIPRAARPRLSPAEARRTVTPPLAWPLPVGPASRRRPPRCAPRT